MIDMNEMIGYIFGNLQQTEKTLKQQARFNRGLVLFAVMAMYGAYLDVKLHADNERKIKELKSEIETLKNKTK